MSGAEHDYTGEQRSSVAVTMNAKGEAQVAVKVYTGQDAGELEAARELAVRIYADTARAVRVQAGGSS